MYRVSCNVCLISLSTSLSGFASPFQLRSKPTANAHQLDYTPLHYQLLRLLLSLPVLSRHSATTHTHNFPPSIRSPGQTRPGQSRAKTRSRACSASGSTSILLIHPKPRAERDKDTRRHRRQPSELFLLCQRKPTAKPRQIDLAFIAFFSFVSTPLKAAYKASAILRYCTSALPLPAFAHTLHLSTICLTYSWNLVLRLERQQSTCRITSLWRRHPMWEMASSLPHTME